MPLTRGKNKRQIKEMENVVKSNTNKAKIHAIKQNKEEKTVDDAIAVIKINKQQSVCKISENDNQHGGAKRELRSLKPVDYRALARGGTALSTTNFSQKNQQSGHLPEVNSNASKKETEEDRNIVKNVSKGKTIDEEIIPAKRAKRSCEKTEEKRSKKETVAVAEKTVTRQANAVKHAIKNNKDNKQKDEIIADKNIGDIKGKINEKNTIAATKNRRARNKTNLVENTNNKRTVKSTVRNKTKLNGKETTEVKNISVIQNKLQTENAPESSRATRRVARDNKKDPHNENEFVERKLRSSKPVNYSTSSSDLNKNSTKVDHIPVYKREIPNEVKQKGVADVYEFPSDGKKEIKKKKRKTPKTKNKTTWTKKAKEVIELLGLDITSKTLKQDVEKLIENKSKKVNQIDDSGAQSDVPEATTSKNNSFEIPSAPNANSTMIHSKNHQVPWRPSLPIKYNPHFLKVKTNSLPSVDQEIVLDATFSKNNANDMINPTNATHNTIPNQQTTLNFVENQKNDYVKDNNVSLFDIDEHSPFRCKHLPQNQERKNCEKSKRNILKDISNLPDDIRRTDENTQLPVLKSKTKLPDDAEHQKFLCNSERKTDEENNVNVSPNSDNVENHFRFSTITEEKELNVFPLSSTEIVKNDGGKPVNKNGITKNSAEDQNKNKESEVNDLKDKRTCKSYQKIQGKHLSEDHDNDEAVHKDKKSKKEWTEEAEKWAEQFNSMCEEVENYELETE